MRWQRAKFTLKTIWLFTIYLNCKEICLLIKDHNESRLRYLFKWSTETWSKFKEVSEYWVRGPPDAKITWQFQMKTTIKTDVSYSFLHVPKVCLRKKKISFGTIKVNEKVTLNFRLLGIIGNCDLENHLLHANSIRILAFWT